MSEKFSLPCKHVSHTAWLVAAFRAQESARNDALFHDPLAIKLLGDLEEEYLAGFSSDIRKDPWILSVRTHYIDQIILDFFNQGGEAVLNLGAGLDTRPYRLDLNKKWQWFEVDYAELIAYKDLKLKDDVPRCNLERYSCDLANEKERKAIFDLIDKKGLICLVLTEGLLPYLHANEVSKLASELSKQKYIDFWLIDIFNRSIFDHLHTGLNHEQPGKEEVKFRFMPESLQEFLRPYRWQLRKFFSFGEGALRYNRLPKGISKEALKETTAVFESGVGLFYKEPYDGE